MKVTKRIISLLLTAVMLVGMIPPITVAAESLTEPMVFEEFVVEESFEVQSANVSQINGTCGDNLTWVLENGTLTISGTGAMDDYDFRTSPWYSYCASIHTVIIQDGVTRIGEYAFADCFNIPGVSIPNSVTTIGSYAFYNCKKLTNINIPHSVTSISEGMFSNCASLTSITIPDSVTSIGKSAFCECISLQDVTISGNVSSIGASAFYACASLTSIVIPDSVSSIGDRAFQSCTGLLSIDIPDSVTSIGSYAFYGCSNLSNVFISDSITSISDFLFQSCTSLTSITIPEGITSIGEYSFQNCTNLTNVTIPNSVTSIGNVAFGGCISLTNITIPHSITQLNYGVFSECKNLSNVTIPDSVISIGARVFFGCSGLAKINIPNSVTSIGDRAFIGCTSLTNITIPDSVMIIHGSAFRNCTGLISVTILNSVISIKNAAFYGCTGLTDVYYNGTETVWNATEIGVNNDPLVYSTIHFNSTGPEETEPADNYRLEISPAENLTVEVGQELAINCYLYNGDQLVTDWEHPNYSIANESGLGELECVGWTECENGHTITIKGVSAGVAALTLYHPESDAKLQFTVRVVDNSCGENLQWALEDGTLTIRGNGPMFDFSPNRPVPWDERIAQIKTVVVVEGVTRIGEGTFRNCTSLQFVTLPTTVTSVGDSAFAGCSALEEVFYDGSSVQWQLVQIGSDNEPLTNVVSFEKPLAVVFEEPELLQSELIYDTYKITAKIKNRTPIPLLAVTATINPGEHAVLQEESATQMAAMLASGEEKTFTWTIEIDKRCYPEGGTHYVTVEATFDLCIATSAMQSIAIDMLLEENNALDFTRDVWNFENDGESEGEAHHLQPEERAALLQGLSPSEKAVVASEIAKGSGGHCYGMAVTVILEKMNIIDLSEDTGTQYIANAERTRDVESILCYYQLTQGLKGPRSVNKTYKRKQVSQQLQELESKTREVATGGSPVLFGYSSEHGSHAVVTYAVEEGSFPSFSTEYTYNHRIRIYDCNAAVDNPSCYLLYNDGSGDRPWEWEIPGYVESAGWWSGNPKAYLSLCTNDLNIIDAKNYEASMQNYEAELVFSVGARITNSSTGQSWAVSEDLGTVHGDTEIVYYHSAADLNSDGPADIHIVLPDEAANYIVEPLSGSADELDFYVLYDEKFVGISAGAAAGLSFSEDGEIVLNGNGGAFELTVADDNIPAGAFNTYTVSGDTEGDITVSVSEEGITVNGENLNGVTIEASEGDTVDTMTITENTGEVALEREENGLVEVEEEHTHEYGAPTFVWDENHHCSVTLACAGCDDLQTLNCTVTTVTEAEKIIYTATVEFNGQTYTNTLEEIIETPAPGPDDPDLSDWEYTIQDDCVSIVKYLGEDAHVVAPDSINGLPVTEIQSAAFYMNSIIVNVELPEGIACINNSTFAGCSNLVNIHIPDAVTTIDNAAFQYCENLTEIFLPGSIAEIGGFAFLDCNRLTDVYYGGTEQDRQNIDISDTTLTDVSGNISLENATWHYNSSGIDPQPPEPGPVVPDIHGSWTTDLVMSAADLGVSAPDSVLRATFTFNEDGTATTTWEAVDLTAFRMFFHDMFVNAYYAMAYGAGITDLNEIEAFCRESTGMSVSDYMDTLVTDEAMRSAFTPASTSGVYRLNEEQNGLYTDMAIMDVQSDPDEENSFVIGNGTMYLNAASYGKPEYTFVCTRVE